MEVSAASQLALIIVVGLGVQWVATLARLPAILFLLAAGVVLGPVTGAVDPDELFGELLFPAVALGVGLLLFEGGLGLRLDRFQDGRSVLVRLVTVGVLITWLLAAGIVHFAVNLSWSESLLIGSILTVSGPTVVLPLVRLARPREPVASILRWEGILIDPIGATLAIVVLNAVVDDTSSGRAALRVAETAGAGTAAGLAMAIVLVVALDRHWVPDHLHNPVTLLVLVGAFALANTFRPEAGLFATTVLGVALANQRRVPVRHIRSFQEDIGALILASLFVILGALVDLEALDEFLIPALAVVVVLVLVVRPLVVAISTVGAGLVRAERIYLACMAPRGIVAAAVATVFALELEEVGQHSEALIPVVFLVIFATVTLYGLAAAPAARMLRMARPEPRGVALIGGRGWVLELADALAADDVPVLVVANSQRLARQAAERGLLAYAGRLDSAALFEAVEGTGVRVAVAASPTEELNAFGIRRLAEVLGRANLYHVPVDDDPPEHDTGEREVKGRRAFGASVTQPHLEKELREGGRFAVMADASGLPEGALHLFSLDAEGLPSVCSEGSGPPDPTSRLVVLVPGSGSGD